MKILNFKDFNISESGEYPDENLFGMSENEFIDNLRKSLKEDGEGSIFKIQAGSNNISLKWIFTSTVRKLLGVLEDEMGCFITEPNIESIGSIGISLERKESLGKNTYELKNKKYGRKSNDFTGDVFFEHNYGDFDEFIKGVRDSIDYVKDQVKNFEFKVEKHISVNKTIKKNIEEVFQEEAKILIDNLVDKPNLKYKDLSKCHEDYSDEISDLLEECIIKSIYEDPKLKKEFEDMPETTRKIIFKNLDGIVPEPDKDMIERLEKIRGVRKFLRSIYA